MSTQPNVKLQDNIVPLHIAIIMDGNGRWARARNLPRIAGHKKGANAIRETMEYCSEVGVRYLTIYAFSAENWKRSPEEVESLMDLLRVYLRKELSRLHDNNISIRIIGDRSKLAEDIQEGILKAEELTKNNDGLFLNIALNYGSRQEIVNAAKTVCEEVMNGQLDASTLNEQLFSRYLYTHDLPELDLLIRTGKEQRLSNFLLWQSAYTELYFTDTLWPDFTKADMMNAIDEFAKRERRYGTS